MDVGKLKKPTELRELRRHLESDRSSAGRRALICMTGCRAKGAAELGKTLRGKVAENGLADEVEIVDVGCHGQCSGAPLILIEPENYLFGNVKESDLDEIVQTTLLKGEPINRLSLAGDVETGKINDIPFFKAQDRRVLANCGRIDPRSIESAIIAGCYETASRALATMSPEDVVNEVSDSELRGRGGAGFPTGRKWKFVRDAPGEEKYLICNADEGDPGAFMDRALLEGTPHQIIEGMLLAAYAIGAQKGYVYVRAEYPVAVEHITKAVDDARALGLLGESVLGTDFRFDLEIRKGSGAFVCGEETALIASLEGKRGMPRPRPPFPAHTGFRDCPTTINNVETLANIPLIIRDGAEAYRSLGTPGGRGTKIFALAGKVRETGLVEVPLGTTLRRIVFDIGGGVPDERNFKAAQIGGPSGGCLPAEFLDLPLDYESVKEAGAIMGSGGMIVMDEGTCMVDVARFFMEFIQKESCGKCPPCRVGTRHLVDILARICTGEGELGDLEKLEELAVDIRAGSLCGLGQTAVNPVLTTLRYFREEYETHIREKRCPAGVCSPLLVFGIIADLCIGCGRCKNVCPVDAISGEPKSPHFVNVALCTGCGACRDVCPEDAVTVS